MFKVYGSRCNTNTDDDDDVDDDKATMSVLDYRQAISTVTANIKC